MNTSYSLPLQSFLQNNQSYFGGYLGLYFSVATVLCFVFDTICTGFASLLTWKSKAILFLHVPSSSAKSIELPYLQFNIFFPVFLFLHFELNLNREGMKLHSFLNVRDCLYFLLKKTYFPLVSFLFPLNWDIYNLLFFFYLTCLKCSYFSLKHTKTLKFFIFHIWNRWNLPAL